MRFAFAALALLGASFGLEVSAPVKWRGEAHLLRYIPRNQRFFTEGMVDLSVDMLALSFGDDASLTLCAGTTIWTGMGYQEEEIIFDPRDMHYSLVPGIRAALWGYTLSFLWYHDCFHEVDRKTEPTIIWNLFEFVFAPESHLKDVRRRIIRRQPKSFWLKPSVDWCLGFGFFPRPKSPFWFQYMHPFWDRIRLEVRVALAGFGPAQLELEYRPTLWIQTDHRVTQRQYAHVALAYYGRFGAMSLFWGYVFREDQPIRPCGKRGLLGIRWEL